MKIWQDFRLAMAKPMVFMIEYGKNPKLMLSALIAGVTCVFSAAAGPLANALLGEPGIVMHYTWGQGLLVFAISACSVGLTCLVFKLLAAIYKKDVSLKQIAATWGVNLIPTLIVIAIVQASEAGFYLFMIHTWLSVLLCTLLVLLMAWKIIFFFMELRLVLELKGRQTVWATVITAAAYFIIIGISARQGLVVPVL